MYNINFPLYKYILEELHATYHEEYFDVQYNLQNDEEKNKKYLGTYFPRSFKESYTIFEDIFTVLIDYGFFQNDTLNILDFGSGTGG